MNTIICRNSNRAFTLRSHQVVMAVAKDNQLLLLLNGTARMCMQFRRGMFLAGTLPAKKVQIVVRKRKRGNGLAKIQMNSLSRLKNKNHSVLKCSSCKRREKIKFMAKFSQTLNKQGKRLLLKAVRGKWWLTFRAKLEFWKLRRKVALQGFPQVVSSQAPWGSRGRQNQAKVPKKVEIPIKSPVRRQPQATLNQAITENQAKIRYKLSNSALKVDQKVP